MLMQMKHIHVILCLLIGEAIYEVILSIPTLIHSNIKFTSLARKPIRII